LIGIIYSLVGNIISYYNIVLELLSLVANIYFKKQVNIVSI